MLAVSSKDQRHYSLREQALMEEGIGDAPAVQVAGKG